MAASGQPALGLAAFRWPRPFFDPSRGRNKKATNAFSGIHTGYGLRGLLVSGPAAFRQWQHLCSCWWCPSAWVCSWTCAPASWACSCPSWLWLQPSWLCSCSCLSLSWQHIFASPPGYFLTSKISISPGAVNGCSAQGARGPKVKPGSTRGSLAAGGAFPGCRRTKAPHRP